MFAIVTCDRFADHLTPPGHPERPARALVMQAVASVWADRGVPRLEPRPATRDELLRVHSAAYVDRIEQTAGRALRLDPDTFTSGDTAAVAALAAGAAIVAVDAVLGGRPVKPGTREDADEGENGRRFRPSGRDTPTDVTAALALVRPPGHHAEAARAMGFCIYNNVALAAAHALARGIPRVAVVDVDVHHGNGTQWAFYGDPRVLYASTHQFPFYPGTGAAREAGSGDGEGFTVNVPLYAGATDGDYALVFDRVLLPVLRAFRPGLLLVSAGFDAHMRDPLATMCMSVGGFNDLARRLRDFADSAPCPIVLVTEGGYHLKVLGASLDGVVRAFVHADDGRADADSPLPAVSGGGPRAEPLRPDDAPLVDYPTRAATERGLYAVDLVRRVQKRYWPGL